MVLIYRDRANDHPLRVWTMSKGIGANEHTESFTILFSSKHKLTIKLQEVVSIQLTSVTRHDRVNSPLRSSLPLVQGRLA